MKKKMNFYKKAISVLLVGSIFTTFTIGNLEVLAAPEVDRASQQPDNPQVKTKKEIIQLRNEKSKTFLNNDGSYTTEISQKPIHYKDKTKNQWLPIDNNLSTNAQEAYNSNHEFEVSLDKKHTSTNNLLEIKEDKFEIGLNPVLPTGSKMNRSASISTGEAEDNVMTYSDIYPNADLIYTLGNDRIKEEIKLYSKPKPNDSLVYSFALDLNNLDYRLEENGSITLFDSSTGETQYFIDRPLMYDSYKPEGYKQAEGISTYPEESVSYNIHYELKKRNGNLYIDVVPDQNWLNDPKRIYPVTVDPTIVKYQPTYRLADTNIRSAFPKQTGATDTTLGVGLYKDATSSNIIRSLIQFDTSSIPQGANVLTADLNLWLASVSNDTDINVTLHAITKPWTEYSASWMYADATNLWTKQGGDYITSQMSTTPVGPMTSLSANYKWSLSPNIIESWAKDPSSNKGFLIKSSAETTNSYKKFISGDDTANATYTPLLSVTYYSASRLGLEDYWTFDSHSLANGNSYTNLGTGNNVIQFTDYSLTGRGNVSLDFIRTYNSKSVEASPFGYGWSYTGSETIIDAYKTGKVLFTDSDGTTHEFQYNSVSGTYVSPAGKYLTLTKVKNSYGATIGYDLTDKHGYKLHFETVSNDEHVSIIKARVSYEMDLHGNKITYQYDSNGNLTSITDPSGRIITFNYDASGLVDYSVLEGRKTDYTYQNGKLIAVDQYSSDGTYSRTQFQYSSNYIKTVIDPNSRTTTFTYNAELLEKIQEPVTDGSGQDLETRPGTTYSYNLTAHTASVTDPNGNTTNYMLDPNYAAKAITDAQGYNSQYTFDSNYNLTEIIDPKTKSVRRTFDANGNMLSETDEEGNVSSYTYNQFNHVLTAKDPKNNVTTYTYTAYGDVETITDAKQQVTSYAYDNYGNLMKVTYPDNSVVLYSYDEKGNYVQMITDAANNTTTTITDSVGNVISRTDSNGSTTSYQYDKLNHLEQVSEADGIITSYKYDLAGNLVESKNANNAVDSYVYNGLNQLIKETNALGKISEYTYDNNGNLIHTKTPNGNTISTTYNKLNQVKSIIADGVQWTYNYDPNGNLISINNDHQFTYTDDDQVESETDRGNIKNYEYNANNLLETLTFTAGTSLSSNLQYVYNELDQVVSVKKNNQTLVSYEYNAVGALTKTIRGNGLFTRALYDSGNRLQSFGNYTASDQLISQQSFTYDGNGNISTIQTGKGALSYTYDERDQLTKEVLTDGTEVTYDYDKVGNRIQKSVTKGTQTNTTNYSYNEGNHLESVNGQTYSYDFNGNLVNDGQHKYIYDAFDQLIEVKQAEEQFLFKASYDEQGRRIQTQTADGITNYFYDGDHVLYETDGNNNITVEYTWDNAGNPVAMTVDGQTYYYHLNGHGDVVSMTDHNGLVVASYEYDAWGNILAKDGVLADVNPYRYAGYRYDESTGLYYLTSRYYNASLGRFIIKDKYRGINYVPLSLNQFTYSNNNPVMYTDPSGSSVSGVFGTAGVAAAADGPLPIGDIVAGGILLGYGIYKGFQWATRPRASLSDGIPKKLLKDKDHVDLGQFTEPAKGKKKYTNKKTGWSIEKDTAGHAGKKWKLKDAKDKRQRSLDGNGKIISK